MAEDAPALYPIGVYMESEWMRGVDAGMGL